MRVHKGVAVLLAGGLSFAACAATVTWTGAGGTANWSTPGNWAGAVPPSTGDSLVFPAGGTASNNDLPSTTYASLTFSGFTGCIGGTGFSLSSATPITTGASGGCIAAPVTFAASTAALANTGTLQLKGTVSGNAIAQTGTGTLQLFNGTNNFSGALHAGSGTLSLASRDVVPDLDDLLIDPGATLTMVSRDVVRGASLRGTWNVQVRGPVAGQYSQILANGGITLGGTLQVTSAVAIDPGTVLTIIGNQSGAQVTGTFSGLPEGATILSGPNTFRISYLGGFLGTDVTLTAIPPLPSANAQDMWWAGGVENGWGLSIVQHSDKLFIVLFIYDATGKPTWYVMPSGQWNSTQTAWTGKLYLTHGSPYYAYDPGQFNPGGGEGEATITFTDADHAVLDYLINDVPGSKVITRQLFGPPAAFGGADRGDMWWGGPTQNGWGMPIIRQYASYFMVWFTYDATGAPTWFVIPAPTIAADGTWSGRIYRTTGSPWIGRTYDASQLAVTDAGSFTLTFIGDLGVFQYNVDGHTGTLNLDRQLF